MSLLRPVCRACGSALAILSIVAAGRVGAAGAERSPFIPQAAAPASAPVSMGPDLLQGVEFAGYVRIGDQLQVYLCPPDPGRGQWLALGVPGEEVLVEEYNADRQAVRVRAGTHERWLLLRGVKVAPVVMVLRDDRGIDWDHLKLSNRQKELKAAGQMWEMMEVTRHLRVPEGELPPPGSGRSHPALRTKSSPGS